MINVNDTEMSFLFVLFLRVVSPHAVIETSDKAQPGHVHGSSHSAANETPRDYGSSEGPRDEDTVN